GMRKTTMKTCLATLSVLILAALGAHALAQRAQGDDAAIRQALEAYSRAFNRGQAPATGPAFVENALYVTADGERIAGRAAIVKRLRDYLATHKGDQLRVTAESILFVNPEIAEVDGNAEIRGPGGPPDISPYTALLVKREGRWMIQSMRDLSPADEEANMSP